MLVYLDTNIYLDYLGNRCDNLRPLGEFAFQLINRALQCEFNILFSDLVLKELECFITKEHIEFIIKLLQSKNKIFKVQITSIDKRLASKLKNSFHVPYADALHYVLALNNDAEVLITNDKHFSLIYNPKIKISCANEL
ncbi:MAG: type II toxin-antitoxin system VapC family toxin [Nanoarchaeota archaeon]|nr:type II toxin-antitoxin system VapC family toxin [Nanoarchaeota archaeon]